MKKLTSILCILSLLMLTSAFAETAVDIKTIQVCQRLQKVMKPKGTTPDNCYDQAREYLKQKKIKIMSGSYQAYFALSTDDKTQLVCRTFLRSVVASTQELELDEARELFENDKAQSLDQAYYSYQQCADRAKSVLSDKPASAESKAVK